MIKTLDEATAIAKIKEKITQIAGFGIGRATRFCPAYIKWHRDTVVLLQHIFGPSAYQVRDFTEIDPVYRASGPLAYSSYGADDHTLAENRYRSAVQEMGEILASIYEEIQEFGLSRGDPATHNPISLVDRIALSFHAVARQLRMRHACRQTLNVEDEFDVQDLLHALLRIFFNDVRPEEWTPSYAGSSSRMDFLLHKEQIVIEVKMTREGLKQKELVDQLLVDIARYEEHPRCKTLVCFVYDPAGWIGNPTAVIEDIEKGDRRIAVRVFVRPEH